jgi:hypothetical protein
MALRAGAAGAYAQGMKAIVLAGLFLPLAACLARADDGKFTSTLSAADLAATGVGDLSPAQRARLDELAEAYRNGALAAAAHQPAAVVPPAPAADVTPSPVPAAAPPPAQGFFARLKIPKRTGAAPKPAPPESSIPGRFRGWSPRQIFILANGERWREANGENYYSPVVDNPRVRIVPSAFGGHWLQFPDLNLQVRVIPLADN